MAKQAKAAFLQELTRRFGNLVKLGNSYSLYEIGDGVARLYIRYSKMHSRGRTFYGLRDEDLRYLEGYPSFICLLWDEQTEPLLVPYSEYEDIFQSTEPAPDGQYKVQVYQQQDGTDLYIARVGRFNVEGYFGWAFLEDMTETRVPENSTGLTHTQIQTLLGAIGKAKGFDIWIPANDRPQLDWGVADPFDCREFVPYGFERVESVLREVDVIWLQRGSSSLHALFEVEHSTPIYSGLLRFNDILLAMPAARTRFSIVANNVRRSLFARQLHRLTFQTSGLSEVCTFLEYTNVLNWYRRISIDTLRQGG